MGALKTVVSCFPASSHYYQLAAVVVTGLAAAALVAWWYVFTPLRYPKSLPRIGQDRGLSWTDMKTKFATDCMAVLDEAYNEYSKKDKAVLIPVGDLQDEVIIPTSRLPWLHRLGEDKASSLAAQVEAIGLEYSLGRKFAFDPWGGHLIKSDLNAALDKVGQLVADEVGPAVESCFGSDNADGDADKGGDDNEVWHDVHLFAACRTLIARTVLSFVLGDSPRGRELCADKAFMESCYGVLDGMLEVAGALAAIRVPLRPILGWKTATKARMPERLASLEQGFRPVHDERLKEATVTVTGEKEGRNDKPNDLIQIMYDYAIEHRPAEAASVSDMTRRLAIVVFGTMHQTVVALHNMMLDVAGSDGEFDTVAVLRDEAERVLGPYYRSDDGHGHDQEGKSPSWAPKSQLARLTRIDSCARETLRTRTFLGRNVQRLVVAPGEGVVLWDGVTHIPRGAVISVLAHHAQMDPDSFPPTTRSNKDGEAEENGRGQQAGEKEEQEEEQHSLAKFDPYRTSRVREAAAAINANVTSETGTVGANHLSFVSISANNLSFGHGRHACPGRDVAGLQIKMLVAYVVMHYEVRLAASEEAKKEEDGESSGEKDGKQRQEETETETKTETTTRRERPANSWFFGFGIPPLDAKLSVRRRTTTGKGEKGGDIRH